MFEIVDLSKIYITKEGSVKALDKINIKLPSSGFVSIVGESGSGKTTLLKILGGLDKVTSGDIFYNDICLNKLDENELTKYRGNIVSYLFQENNLIDLLNVEENIYLSLDTFDCKKINEALKIVGLEEFNKRPVNELSGGQKQRVAIARCMAKNCKVLLCDEPTSSLDDDNSRNIFELLKQISKNILVIVSSHNIKLVEEYSDDIIHIESGQVSKTNKDILNKEKTILKPTRTSFSKIAKIGVKHLKRKKNKLVLAAILCFMSSVFLMCMLSSYSFNKHDLAINEYFHDNDNYIMLRHKDYLQEITKENCDFVKEESNRNFLRAKNMDSLITNMYVDYETMTLFDSARISNVVDYNQQFIISNNYTLLAGSYPSEDNDILMTDYIFQMFERNGYLSQTNKKPEPIINYSDMVGKTIKISGLGKPLNCKISGIIDTNFNNSKYDVLKGFRYNETPSNNRIRYMFTFDYISIMKESIHSSIFLKGFDDIFGKDITNIDYCGHPDALISSSIDLKGFKSLLELKDYQIYHYAIHKTEATSTYFVPIRGILTGVGFGLFVLSFLTMVNFIKLSVSDSKNEIRVLKSIGFDKADIRKIYSFETLTISMSSSIFSVLMSIGFVLFVNYMFDTYLAVYTSVINYRPYLPILIILINGLLSITSVLVGTRKLKYN